MRILLLLVAGWVVSQTGCESLKHGPRTEGPSDSPVVTTGDWAASEALQMKELSKDRMEGRLGGKP
ncbi:MAG TPA: hypothetical protein VGF55_05870 [Gemmataceae bacterium]|jgi:hypothetical protein